MEMAVVLMVELKDRKRKAMFGKRIREIVKGNFKWENIIKKFIEVYKSFYKVNYKKL